MRRAASAALAVCALAALTAQAPPATNADEVVRAAAEAPKHVSYVGQLQSTRWSMNAAVSTITRIEHKAPDETRRTYLAPPGLYGSYFVTHGAKTSRYDVKNSRVVFSENLATENQVAFNDNIALLSANYHAIAGPDEAIAGRPTITVSLINRHNGERMMRLWIDAQTRIVLAKESYHSDGSLASRMKFDEIRYTNDIPDGIFATSVPSGFRAVQGRRYAEPSTDIGSVVKNAGFTPIGPRFLPEGFAIIGADVSEVKGVKSLHLLYSDGLRNLSLFENGSNAAADFGTLKPMTTSFEGHDAQYVKDGPTTLLAWREHRLAFALVGDLEIKELTDIAISVVP
ncbi:MAG: sigma-E factor regulatory protein RseB domain-containing protein [Candidatus Velthaea sp.]